MGKRSGGNRDNENPDNGAAAVTEEAKAENESLKERHYQQIRDLNREVKDARAEWQDAKDTASSLKKAYESKNDKLHELISRGPDPQKILPGFTDGADQWRVRPIRDLAISDGIIETLEAEGISSLGDLQRFWDSGKYLSDIKGIGPEKSATVADAFADYGASHPELFTEQIQPDEDAEGEGEDE